MIPQLERCKVIPGKIEMAGRSYEYAEDISDFRQPTLNFSIAAYRKLHEDVP